MKDKNIELQSSIKLVNNKLHFTGKAGTNEPVSIDYIPPLGDDLGYTSLELMLLSLSSCLGSAVLTFLRRMQKTINAFEIQAKGERREEHPTGFKDIYLDIYLDSPDIKNEDMDKVISLAEDKYCPVWSMLKGNTTIHTEYTIK